MSIACRGRELGLDPAIDSGVENIKRKRSTGKNLVMKGLESEEAKSMVRDYEKNRAKAQNERLKPMPTFRDLTRLAEQVIAETGKNTPDAKEKEPGHAIGINLRIASYSNISGEIIDALRPVLHKFARRYNVPLIPLPIAFHAWASDHLAIRQLLQGFDDQSDGGVTLDTPLKVIQQVGRCRIVVTGAYHAAVFALAQGIPVVGLSASDDYTAKFLGLEDQFGLGCETVFLGAPDASEKLAAAAEKAWQSAEKVRLPLQEAARRQIALSQEAYEKIKEKFAFKQRIEG